MSQTVAVTSSTQLVLPSYLVDDLCWRIDLKQMEAYGTLRLDA